MISKKGRMSRPRKIIVQQSLSRARSSRPAQESYLLQYLAHEGRFHTQHGFIAIVSHVSHLVHLPPTGSIVLRSYGRGSLRSTYG